MAESPSSRGGDANASPNCLPAAVPVPPGVESKSPPVATPVKDNALDQYNTVAETVGFMPSLRRKDHILQGTIVAGGAVLGAAIGCVFGGLAGVLLGTLLGLIAATLVSGGILMVLGLRRAAKKTK